MDTIYVKCDCGAETLEVSVLKEDDYKEYYFCIMARMFSSQSWWHRIHSIWHLLRHGTLFTDQIILSKAQVKTLVDFLRKEIKDQK